MPPFLQSTVATIQHENLSHSPNAGYGSVLFHVRSTEMSLRFDGESITLSTPVSGEILDTTYSSYTMILYSMS